MSIHVNNISKEFINNSNKTVCYKIVLLKETINHEYSAFFEIYHSLKKEMEHIIKNYQPELMYMVADTFLAMSPRELDEFSEFYQSYKIPF